MAEWHLVGDADMVSPDKPVAIAIGTASIVLFRTGNLVTALRDRCPHRFAPLSMGKIVDGGLQCAYHGLRFGTDGKCVHNPHGDGTIPALAKVATYGVEQRDGKLYVKLD